MSYIRVLHLFVKVMLHGRYTIIIRRIGVVISIIVLDCYNMTSTERLGHAFLFNHFIAIKLSNVWPES